MEDPLTARGTAATLGSLLLSAAAVVIPAGLVLSGVSLVARYRAVSPAVRHQIKWFMYFGVVAVAIHGAVIGGLTSDPVAVTVLPPVSGLALVLATAVAILRHRLYDIDLVISKTLVYGALAIFIGGVYVAVVVGLGRLAGTGGEPNTALAILATTLIAVAFQPVRERLHGLANRIVFGDRATPLEAVNRFSESMSLGDTQQTLDEMTHVIAAATSATCVEIWRRAGDHLEVTACHPAPTSTPRLRMTDAGLPSFPTQDIPVPIRHRGEMLGALTVTKPPGDPLTGVEERLLADLADQAALVLRNRILAEELRRRVLQVESQTVELTRSRARIVAAHDAERRRLERNIHDGAQQHLVALAVKLGLAHTVAGRNPSKAMPLVEALTDHLDQAEETIRRLAHGLYPGVLTREGIGAALAAEAAASPIPVAIDDATTRRHHEPVEAAAYFCCLEAIQNALKHARASSITLRLADDDGALAFVVLDDGRGFDSSATAPGTGLQSIRDRITAVGGDVSVISTPAAGTRIEGRIPTTPRT